MLTLTTGLLPSTIQLEVSSQSPSFPECSQEDQPRSQDDLDWSKTGFQPNQTGYDQISGLTCTAEKQDWISGPEQNSDFCDSSETSFEEISWLGPTAAYESGDSLDSFSSPSTSLTSSGSAYSLPPTPPATPPNSGQEWLPPVAAKSARFSCSECCKIFADRAHLAEHHRYRHSDDRPHRCPTCCKGFKSRSNLNQHIRTSHERPRFDCQVNLDLNQSLHQNNANI